MSTLLQLGYVFFRIGILTIGGGMAMLPLIQDELTSRGWLTDHEFMNILGISEMTPGPMAVNAATYVGYHIGGIPGSIVATSSLCLPSLFCVAVFGFLWVRNRERPLAKKILAILRPLVAGLILAVALNLLCVCVFPTEPLPSTIAGFDWRALLVATLVCGFSASTKIHPVMILLGGTAIGTMLYM